MTRRRLGALISRCRYIDRVQRTPHVARGTLPPALSEAYHPALHRARIEPDHRNVIPQRRYPLRGPSHSLAPSTENVSSGTWEHCSLRLLGPGLVHPLNSKELLPCG